MSLLGLTGLLNALTSIVCGAVVALYSTRRQLAIPFAVYNLCVAGWSAGYAAWQSTTDATEALFWLRVLMFFAIWINQAALYFVCVFIGREKDFRTLLRVLFALNICWSGLNFSPLLYAEMVQRFDLGLWPLPKPLFHVFLFFYQAEDVLVFYLLISNLKNLSPEDRPRAHYILAGFLLAYVGGHSNWPVWYGFYSFPYLNALVSVYVAITAYAIARYRVLDTKVVLKSTILYSALTVLLSAAYVSVLVLLSRSLTIPSLSTSPWVSAAAAAMIAILFHPLRIRLQAAIDRRFPRESLDQRLLREATGGFVHEIKRPLSNISLPAQLALQDLQAVRQGNLPNHVLQSVEDRLRYIVDKSNEAGETIEALRDLLIGGGGERRPVDLRRLVDQLIGKERSLSGRLGIVIEVQGPVSPMYVLGNHRQLEVALANIMRNGVEAMKDALTKASGKLSVELEQMDAVIRVRVRDQGDGLAPGDQRRMFDPWFTKKSGSGMGLGLFLAREVLRAHQAELSIESRPGAGTTVGITFPAFHPEQST
jgi:signal transduction histidine kinase